MNKYIFSLLLILGLVKPIQAQLIDFDSEAITKDFVYNLNIYSNSFIGPILSSYGPSQIASTHITAKTLKPFAFGIGLSGSGTFVDDDDIEFNFFSKPFSDNLTLSNPNKPVLPSILGGNISAQFNYRVEDKSGLFTYNQKIDALDGLTTWKNSIPAAAINLNVGLPMQTEVFMRILPRNDIDGLENYVIGGGAKHVISQYFLEEDSKINVAIAGFAGKSKFTFVPKNFLSGNNQEIVFISRTYSGEVIASYDRKYFSIFGLIGFYSGATEFNVNGTYRYEVEENGVIQEAFSVTNPISLSADNSGIQTQFGASVNFSTYGSLALTYSFAENNSIGFNLRFYLLNGD